MVFALLLVLAVSMFVLVKSSDFFVEAAARIAKRFGVSELVIGLTIVAIGTSLPEFASSVTAAAEQQTSLAVGTVVGSNIANIGLILGIGALLVPLRLGRKEFMRDCSIMLWVSFLFYLMCLNGTVSMLEGALLLVLAPVYIAFLLHFRPKMRQLPGQMTSYMRLNYLSGSRALKYLIHPRTYVKLIEALYDRNLYRFVSGGSAARDILILLASLFFIYLSSKYLVSSAIELAMALGVTQSIIGATLVAVGTSLPELSVSLSAIRKGFTNILVGNVLGSNILNILLVAGAAAMVSPLVVLPAALAVSLPFMILNALLLFAFVMSDRGISRTKGLLFMGLYLLFLCALLGWSILGIFKV